MSPETEQTKRIAGEGRRVEVEDLIRPSNKTSEHPTENAGCDFDRIPCRVITLTSTREAAISGFASGFFDAFSLDIFGESLPTFVEHPPFGDDLEALSCDWRLVQEDLDRVFRETVDEVLAGLRRAVAEHQGTLFDADI